MDYVWVFAGFATAVLIEVFIKACEDRKDTRRRR